MNLALIRKSAVIFILFIVFIGPATVSGQSSFYHQFPDSNSYWTFNCTIFCFVPWSPMEQTYSIVLEEDTSIGGVSYRKLLMTGSVLNYPCSIPNPAGILPGYKGALREDTVSRKVYIVPPSASVEELLYDFTLQPGDSVTGYLQAYFPGADVVTALDSVLVGSSYRKRWFINNYYSIYYIEGIGSTYGLIEPSPGAIMDGPSIHLTCFNQDGISLYQAFQQTCQVFYTAVDDQNFALPKISVYPDPSDGIFTIESHEHLSGAVSLLALTGKVIFEEQVTFPYLLNKTELKSGMYLLSVRSFDGTFYRQLITIL